MCRVLTQTANYTSHEWFIAKYAETTVLQTNGRTFAWATILLHGTHLPTLSRYFFKTEQITYNHEMYRTSVIDCFSYIPVKWKAMAYCMFQLCEHAVSTMKGLISVAKMTTSIKQLHHTVHGCSDITLFCHDSVYAWLLCRGLGLEIYCPNNGDDDMPIKKQRKITRTVLIMKYNAMCGEEFKMIFTFTLRRSSYDVTVGGLWPVLLRLNI